ncbi:Transposase, partial [Dysosmobacter welbionis]
LRDQVGGDHHGAGVLRVFLHQQLVEQVPVLGVQTQNRLVKQHIGGVDAETQNQTED